MPLTASAGGYAVAVAIGGAGVLRFVRWLIEFIARRLDIRADRIDAREEAIERRMIKRLEHVERELEATREALMLMINRMAEKDPADPVLRDVARILRNAIPIVERRDDLEGLIEQLGAVPGTRELRGE